MRYYKNYIATRDIDWFCQIGGIWIHVASAGGALPNIVNNRAQNMKMQDMVAEELDDHFSGVLIANESLIRNELEKDLLYNYIETENNTTPFDTYISSFKRMAGKGFYSFDRTNINDPADNSYRLVAYPRKPLTDELRGAPQILKRGGTLDTQSLIDGGRIDLIALINGTEER